ncbi:MAG: DUF697 domain-containing protein [Rhodothermales bacterium]
MSTREAADAIVKKHVLLSIGGGLIPIPLADMAAVTALQVSMLEQLADLYEVSYSRSIAKSFVAALTGSTAAKLGSSLIKMIPGVGSFIGGVAMSATSGASTYAVGQVAISQFESSGTLEDIDLDKAREAYEEAFEEGKEVVETLEEEKQNAEMDGSEDVLEKLEKLAALREKGVVTEEEFEAQKQKLLDRL